MGNALGVFRLSESVEQDNRHLAPSLELSQERIRDEKRQALRMSLTGRTLTRVSFRLSTIIVVVIIIILY